MKKTSVFQNGLIWFGAGVSLAEILTGTSFAPLGFARGFAAIVTGHVIGCALFFLAGLIGGRSGRSAMETVKMSFGQKGGLLFAALNVLQLVGWTAIMIYDGALAAGGIFSAGHWVWCLVTGGLILVWILVGVTNLGWINQVSMTALFVVIFLDQWKSMPSHIPAVVGIFSSVFFLLLLGPDRFLLPSLAENYATSTLEAMACGTPVVGFAAGGTPEQLRGKRGIAVKAGSQEEFTAAVDSVLEGDCGLLQGEELARSIREENAAEVMVRQYRELYRELCCVTVQTGR